MWFEEYIESCHLNYYKNNQYYGVEPLFEPIEALSPLGESIRKELNSKGINPRDCQFLDPVKGCLIPDDKKPDWCQEEIHVCQSVYENLDKDFKFIKRIKTKQFDDVYFHYQGIDIRMLLGLSREYSYLRFYYDKNDGMILELLPLIKNKIIDQIPEIRLLTLTGDFTFSISYDR
jgi:hypothetical protein